MSRMSLLSRLVQEESRYEHAAFDLMSFAEYNKIAENSHLAFYALEYLHT